MSLKNSRLPNQLDQPSQYARSASFALQRQTPPSSEFHRQPVDRLTPQQSRMHLPHQSHQVGQPPRDLQLLRQALQNNSPHSSLSPGRSNHLGWRHTHRAQALPLHRGEKSRPLSLCRLSPSAAAPLRQVFLRMILMKSSMVSLRSSRGMQHVCKARYVHYNWRMCA